MPFTRGHFSLRRSFRRSVRIRLPSASQRLGWFSDFSSSLLFSFPKVALMCVSFMIRGLLVRLGLGLNLVAFLWKLMTLLAFQSK